MTFPLPPLTTRFCKIQTEVGRGKCPLYGTRADAGQIRNHAGKGRPLLLSRFGGVNEFVAGEPESLLDWSAFWLLIARCGRCCAWLLTQHQHDRAGNREARNRRMHGPLLCIRGRRARLLWNLRRVPLKVSLTQPAPSRSTSKCETPLRSSRLTVALSFPANHGRLVRSPLRPPNPSSLRRGSRGSC